MIPIKNIYYMLSYAFKALDKEGFRRVQTESFDNVFDLYSAILVKGVSIQLKMGLDREYIVKEEETAAIKGKINISDSIRFNSFINNKLVCSYDDYSENSYLNRILKTTMLLLLDSDIDIKRKKELRKLLFYFSNVDILDKNLINWRFNYNRNNQHYKLLMAVCHMIIMDLLQTESKGKKEIMDFSDNQRMSSLYEKFIYEYYKKEYPDIGVSSPHIKWQVDDGYQNMLPRMMTDIMLTRGKKILIIDAKYWSSTTQSRHDKQTVHSSNLYQIFSYVKNKQEEVGKAYEVSGMLLYARTDQDIQPDETYKMSGNRIDVRTLDLNFNFKVIEEELEYITEIVY